MKGEMGVMGRSDVRGKEKGMMRTRKNKIRACEVDDEKIDHELRDLHRRKVFFPLPKR